MIPPAWVPLLVLIFLLGVILQLPWLVSFAVAVGAVLYLARRWANHTLDHISYQRRWHYRRGFPGEKTDLRIEVRNQKWLPLSWLRTGDAWPNAVAPTDTSVLAPSHLPDTRQLVNVYHLRWQERISRSFEVVFRQRGIHPLGPVELQSSDLFGLYTQTGEQSAKELLVVFPEILPLARLSLSAEDPFGDRRAQRRLFEDPNQTIGVRPYHPEDGFRRIHWPATTRTGSLQTRIYQPVSARTLMLCLNVATMNHIWEGTRPALLEHLVKVCATLAYHGSQDGYAVGLISNGCLAHADQPFRINPGRSPDQLALLLQALAGVTAYTSAPFEAYLLRSLTSMPLGATLVIITAILSPTLPETLLRLRRYRAHTTLLSLAREVPPNLPDVRVVHLPFEQEAA